MTSKGSSYGVGLGDGWMVEFALGEDEKGSPVIKSVEIRPEDGIADVPVGGVSKALLSKIKFPPISSPTYTDDEYTTRGVVLTSVGAAESWIAAAGVDFRAMMSERPGRKRRHPGWYALIGAIFLDGARTGMTSPRAFTAEILSRHSSEPITPDQVRPWMAKARRDGLVTPGLKGRAFGGPTPKGMDAWEDLWLEEEARLNSE